MKLRSALVLWLTPIALASGCLLPSFENVPDSGDAEGGSGGSSEGGQGPAAAGSDASAGAALGGESSSGALELASDQYVVEQGQSLQVAARDGVLINDAPDGLSVSGFDATDAQRPEAFDAAELDIAADGSLTFTPADGYFGRYVVSYTAEDDAGQSAMSTVTFIVQPTAAALDTVAQGVGGVMLTGSAGEGLGASVTALGDVNDDGYDDFAVAAPGGSSGHGSIYVVFGRADFAALSLGALADTSKETRYAVLAGSAQNPVAAFVSSAGTFDSDTIPDIAVGSPGSANGTIFVVFGGTDLKTTLTLSSMLEPRGIALTGAAPGERLGQNVSGAGDYNGDEKTDLVSGIHPDGLAKGGVCTLLDIPVESSSISALSHPIIDDSSLFDLPLSLAFAGDVNADGKDVLASSKRHVALIFGQGSDGAPADISTLNSEGYGLLRTRPAGLLTIAAVAAAGDVDGDGKADFAYCDEFASQPRCQVFFRSLVLTDQAQDPLATGDWQVDGFAGAPTPPLLATGADLNQDGFSDLLLADSDAAYVVFGRDDGFGAVDVTSLGSDGFSLAAPMPGAIGAVSTIGDVNGDGYGDFALGEPAAASDSGQVYVVFGGPFAAAQL